MKKKDILYLSLKDLQEDFNEQKYLCSTLLNKLTLFTKDIQKRKEHIHWTVYKTIQEQTDQLIKTNKIQYQSIQESLLVTKENPALAKNLKKLITQKEVYYQMLRNLSIRLASLIVSTDFQSPSFSHSISSQAGRQEGLIEGHINDYKRDQHMDGIYYEKAFLKEYIGSGIFKNPISVFLTSSGMAAFTTIMNYLLIHEKIVGLVIVGKGIYFENKEVVKGLFKTVIEVDESNTKEVILALQKEKPSLVIFDSLCNSYNIEVPNILEIIEFLKKQKREIYVIVDNTGMPLFCEPIKKLLGKKSNIKLFVFESLNKYYQFGMDRVTGGVVYTSFSDKDKKLFFLREHVGTIMPDVSVLAMPAPNKKLLQKRLKRFERNALLLSLYLSRIITQYKNGPYEEIIYPKTRLYTFHGSYFVIHLKPTYQKPRTYQRFIRIVLQEARKRDINIVEGTSFGLNTTRIYLTSLYNEYGKPFLRVSVGTETRMEMEVLKEVFKAAMDRFVKPVHW